MSSAITGATTIDMHITADKSADVTFKAFIFYPFLSLLLNFYALSAVLLFEELLKLFDLGLLNLYGLDG